MDMGRRQEMSEMLDQALVEKFGDEFRELKRDQSLQEAGLDSVDILDTIAIIEKVAGVLFERDELMELDTLDDLYELVFRKLDENTE